MIITILVGPPASGKSTLSKQYVAEGYVRVNTDDQGKHGQRQIFEKAVADGKCIIVDRMNFDRNQRNNYLSLAKQNGYVSKIIVLHEPYSVCLERARKRENHPTVKDEETARKALDFFFKSYERPLPDEADSVEFRYPEGPKPSAIICDLDGTLCNIEHRQHFVKPDTHGGVAKKDWKSFFYNMPYDTVNQWCADILKAMGNDHIIVYASGRPDSFATETMKWLIDNKLCNYMQSPFVFMRPRSDHREDSIVKEIILDFEILTRFSPYFMIDDRKRVVDMWRRRGFTCLHCAEGDF
jgi:predicted kinase